MGKPVERITVVGTGTLGTQIAMLSAYAGYKVKVYDAVDGAFAKTLNRLRSEYQMRGLQPSIPWDRWDESQLSVHEASDLGEAVEDADLIIEAVPERLDLKRQVFRLIGEKAPPRAIMATNSSSIPVSRLEESSGRPERCLNLHFYQPLQGTNMVDVMGGSRTTPEAMKAGIAWVRSIGCIPLTVRKEILGFCFNRVWRAVKREVLYMWADGFVDFRDVDRAWMVFTGMRMGPFGIMDQVGLDVVYDIEMVYYEDSKDPRDHPPQTLKDKIEKGEIGVKTGRGFYTYPNPEYLSKDFLKASRK